MTHESSPSPAALAAWLCPVIARACHRAPTSVTAGSALLDVGLDSLTLVFVLTQIEVEHGVELSAEETLALLEAPNIGALARRLAEIIAGRAGVPATAE